MDNAMGNMQLQQPQQQAHMGVPPQQSPQMGVPPQMPMAYYPQAAVPAVKKPSLKDKTQSAVFSTIVKALCLLILLAGFLPFATVSCGPMVSYSVTGYDLAFGGAADDAAEISQGNMGLGMGMGAGQLAALNMLAGVNLLLVAAFVGAALLLVLSLVLGCTKLELMFSLVVAAFSLAAYLQWLGIFSAFTDMFARASEIGGEMISAGPDIGLYAVIVFSSLLLIVAALESIGKMPAFLTKGEEEGEGGGVSPMTAAPAMPATGMYYPPMQQQQPMQGQHQQPQQVPMYAPAHSPVPPAPEQPVQEQFVPVSPNVDYEQPSPIPATEQEQQPPSPTS